MKKIAKIVNTHGINGEVRILSNSDFKEIRFKPQEKIYVDNQELIIENSYNHKNFIILKLQGFNSINEVIGFKNKDILAPSLTRDCLEEDEYFNEDLVGLNVFNQNEENIGEVIAVVDGSQYNFLRIKGKKKGLVPFFGDFISEVDLTNKKIVINELDGLLDED